MPFFQPESSNISLISELKCDGYLQVTPHGGVSDEHPELFCEEIRKIFI